MISKLFYKSSQPEIYDLQISMQDQCFQNSSIPCISKIKSHFPSSYHPQFMARTARSQVSWGRLRDVATQTNTGSKTLEALRKGNKGRLLTPLSLSVLPHSEPKSLFLASPSASRFSGINLWLGWASSHSWTNSNWPQENQPHFSSFTQILQTRTAECWCKAMQPFKDYSNRYIQNFRGIIFTYWWR